MSSCPLKTAASIQTTFRQVEMLFGGDGSKQPSGATGPSCASGCTYTFPATKYELSAGLGLAFGSSDVAYNLSVTPDVYTPILQD